MAVMEPERFRRIPGKRDNESVLADVQDGYIWHSNGSNRYRCLRYNSHDCHAALLCYENVYSMTGTHYHGHDHAKIRKLEFENWCKEQASTTNIRLHSIYEQALIRFGNLLREVQTHVPFNNIRRTLHRVRSSVQPPVPHSPEEADQYLTTYARYRMTLHGEQQFYWGRVAVPNYGDALVFINAETFQAFLETEEIRVDVTFFSAPRGFFQLASLHAISFGIAINIVCFLMTRKTRQLYEAVMNHLIDVCHQQTGRGPAPSLLVSDYEIAILQAMANCFPGGRARGGWYHSGNAMYKRACSLGLAVPFRDVPNVRLLIKMTIALGKSPTRAGRTS